MKQANMTRFLWINETMRPTYVDSLIKITMKKNIFNIQLTKRWFIGESKKKNHPNSSEFDNWAECFMVINSRLLMKAFVYQTGLVASD